MPRRPLTARSSQHPRATHGKTSSGSLPGLSSISFGSNTSRCLPTTFLAVQMDPVAAWRRIVEKHQRLARVAPNEAWGLMGRFERLLDTALGARNVPRRAGQLLAAWDARNGR
jgi:hypothetical protein